MRIALGLILYFLIVSSGFGMEKVFYVLRDRENQALKTLTLHENIIDIVIFQAYVIDNKGNVTGDINKSIIDFGKLSRARLMPMITNKRFDAVLTHQFLSDPIAQKSALITIINNCKKNNFYGAQFDFEMIPLKDKKLLTDFYRFAADLFHKNHLKISFAIAPTLMHNHFPTVYQKKLYEVWQGAYDVSVIGRISDFVTIMAYDQHAIGTIPGPIAGYPWVERVIRHALTFIPANKISLGIPTYSGFWYMGEVKNSNRIIMHYNSLDYNTSAYIVNKFKPPIMWDDINKVNFSFYDSAGLNKYIFFENAASLKEKQKLAIKYKLRGVSIFRIGIEDPNIWKFLASR